MSRLTNLQFCQVWETDFRPWLCLAIRIVGGLRISHYLKLRHRGASWNDIDLPLEDLIIIWLLKITNRTLTLWFNLSFLNEIGIFFKELVLSMFLRVFDDSLLRRDIPYIVSMLFIKQCTLPGLFETSCFQY